MKSNFTPSISTLLIPIPSFLPGAAAVEGAGPPAGAAPAAGAGPPAPTLQMRLPMLTLAKAFANKPGQKGSTFTPAALMRALILSSGTVTSLLCRTKAKQMQVSSEAMLQVNAKQGLPEMVLVAG